MNIMTEANCELPTVCVPPSSRSPSAVELMSATYSNAVAGQEGEQGAKESTGELKS